MLTQPHIGFKSGMNRVGHDDIRGAVDASFDAGSRVRAVIVRSLSQMHFVSQQLSLALEAVAGFGIIGGAYRLCPSPPTIRLSCEAVRLIRRLTLEHQKWIAIAIIRNEVMHFRMLRYEQLKCQTREFLALTGLTPKEFKTLLHAFHQACERACAAKETLAGKPRQRKPGGGRDGPLGQHRTKIAVHIGLSADVSRPDLTWRST